LYQESKQREPDRPSVYTFFVFILKGGEMKKLLNMLLPLFLLFTLLDVTNAELIDNQDGTVTQIRSDGSKLMWLKDANYAHTSGFVPDFLQGKMTYDGAVESEEGASGSWIDSLNASNHLGFNNWRLPKAEIGDDAMSEMAYMFSVELGNQDELINTFPFENIQLSDYWYSTLANPNLVYIFNFFYGIDAVESRYNRRFYAWAVRDIDPRGDLDGDFKITLKDAILVSQILSGSAIESGSITLEADIDANGKIGLEEVIYVLQKISGLRQ
jgi:hypothetical protein